MARGSVSRRTFLKRAVGVAVAGPYLVQASALGKAGLPAASERVTMACVGLGWQGPGNMNQFLQQGDVQMVAVCDLDAGHLEAAKNTVNKHYGNEACATYGDFREMFARDDIDAVMLALPDHWHAPIAIAAAKAGLDIYGEKPFSHRLAEGRAMVEAVKRYGRVWQTGSWQRSQEHFRRAAELVRNGRIGKVVRMEVGLPSGVYGRQDETFQDPPAGLDYDRWLGPAPWAPYCPARVHINWRWHLDYGGGQLMDWIGHHMDIGHWGLGNDDKIGPVTVKATGDFLTEGLWNVPTRYYATCEYPNDIEVILAGGYDQIRAGTKWIGTDGWVWVDRGGWDAHPASLKTEAIGPDEVQLFKSPGHWRNFVDCVKSRAKTLTPAEVAHRSASPGHLAYVSMYTGRKIRWDAAKEEIIGDAEASRLLTKAYRAPWAI